MNITDLLSPITITLSPIIAFLASLSGHFDLKYDKTLEYFTEIEKWVKKSKVDIISQIITAAKSTNEDTQQGEAPFVDRTDDTFIVALVERLDKVLLVISLLGFCKKIFRFYYFSLLIILCYGVLLFILYFYAKPIYLMHEPQLPSITIIIVIYNLFSLIGLFHYKNKLRDEYSRTYDPQYL